MKILAVEDEESFLNSIQEYLHAEAFVCHGVTTFREGVKQLSCNQYDCVLIDITLPDGNGMDLVDEVKGINEQASIIILSAKNSLDDKVNGLNRGADDYIVKPFHLSELNARIKAVTRRNNATQGGNKLEFSNIIFHNDDCFVTVENRPVSLTKKEYSVLFYLAENKDRVVSKDVLCAHLWGDRIAKDESFNFLFSHIKNIKKKLKEANAAVTLRTAYGWGYQLRTKM